MNKGAPSSKYWAAVPRQEQAISLPMSSLPACTIPPLTLWIDPLLHFQVAKGGEEQKKLWTPLGPPPHGENQLPRWVIGSERTAYIREH